MKDFYHDEKIPTVEAESVTISQDKLELEVGEYAELSITCVPAMVEGDEDAIESLTLEDMDTYALLSQRVMKEDIFSIVKSTFMPFGIESDQYTVLGEIIDCVTMENKLTHEKLYGMKLLCNNIQVDVCINEKDLLGEPAIGRRFRGNVWMQGNLCLE